MASPIFWPRSTDTLSGQQDGEENPSLQPIQSPATGVSPSFSPNRSVGLTQEGEVSPLGEDAAAAPATSEDVANYSTKVFSSAYTDAVIAEAAQYPIGKEIGHKYYKSDSNEITSKLNKSFPNVSEEGNRKTADKIIRYGSFAAQAYNDLSERVVGAKEDNRQHKFSTEGNPDPYRFALEIINQVPEEDRQLFLGVIGAYGNERRKRGVKPSDKGILGTLGASVGGELNRQVMSYLQSVSEASSGQKDAAEIGFVQNVAQSISQQQSEQLPDRTIEEEFKHWTEGPVTRDKAYEAGKRLASGTGQVLTQIASFGVRSAIATPYGAYLDNVRDARNEIINEQLSSGISKEVATKAENSFLPAIFIAALESSGLSNVKNWLFGKTAKEAVKKFTTESFGKRLVKGAGRAALGGAKATAGEISTETVQEYIQAKAVQAARESDPNAPQVEDNIWDRINRTVVSTAYAMGPIGAGGAVVRTPSMMDKKYKANLDTAIDVVASNTSSSQRAAIQPLVDAGREDKGVSRSQWRVAGLPQGIPGEERKRFARMVFEMDEELTKARELAKGINDGIAQQQPVQQEQEQPEPELTQPTSDVPPVGEITPDIISQSQSVINDAIDGKINDEQAMTRIADIAQQNDIPINDLWKEVTGQEEDIVAQLSKLEEKKVATKQRAKSQVEEHAKQSGVNVKYIPTTIVSNKVKKANHLATVDVGNVAVADVVNVNGEHLVDLNEDGILSSVDNNESSITEDQQNDINVAFESAAEAAMRSGVPLKSPAQVGRAQARGWRHLKDLGYSVRKSKAAKMSNGLLNTGGNYLTEPVFVISKWPGSGNPFLPSTASRTAARKAASISGVPTKEDALAKTKQGPVVPVKVNPKDLEYKQTPDGESATRLAAYHKNKEVGYIEANYNKRRNAIQVGMTEVVDAYQNNKIGIELYEKLIKEAKSKGMDFISDAHVTKDAERVWEGLKKRGYEVTKDPEATYDEKTGFWESSGIELDAPVFTLKTGTAKTEEIPAAPAKPAKPRGFTEKPISEQEKPAEAPLVPMKEKVEKGRPLGSKVDEAKRRAAEEEIKRKGAEEKAKKQEKERLDTEFESGVKKSLEKLLPGAEVTPTAVTNGTLFKIKLPNGVTTGVLIKDRLRNEVQIQNEQSRKSTEAQLGKLTDEEYGTVEFLGTTDILFSGDKKIPSSALILLAQTQYGKRRTIGQAEITLIHELIHFSKATGLITKKEWKSLVNKFSSQNKSEIEQEEDVAIGISEWGKIDDGILNKIFDFFAKIFSSVTGKNIPVSTIIRTMRKEGFWKRKPNGEWTLNEEIIGEYGTSVLASTGEARPGPYSRSNLDKSNINYNLKELRTSLWKAFTDPFVKKTEDRIRERMPRKAYEQVQRLIADGELTGDQVASTLRSIAGEADFDYVGRPRLSDISGVNLKIDSQRANLAARRFDRALKAIYFDELKHQYNKINEGGRREVKYSVGKRKPNEGLAENIKDRAQHILDNRREIEYSDIKQLAEDVKKLTSQEIKDVFEKFELPLLIESKGKMAERVDNWFSNIKMSAEQAAFGESARNKNKLEEYKLKYQGKTVSEIFPISEVKSKEGQGPSISLEIIKQGEEIINDVLNDEITDRQAKGRVAELAQKNNIEPNALWKELTGKEDDIQAELNARKSKQEKESRKAEGEQKKQQKQVQQQPQSQQQQQSQQTQQQAQPKQQPKPKAQKAKFGRPDLANIGETPAERNFVEAVDEARNRQGMPKKRSLKAIRARSAQRLKNNYEGEKKRILKIAKGGGQLNAVDTISMKTIAREDISKAIASGDKKKIREAFEEVVAYRNTGSEQSLGFMARFDPKETFAERNKRMIGESIIFPGLQTAWDFNNYQRLGERSRAAKIIDAAIEESNRIRAKLIEAGFDLSEEGIEKIASDRFAAARALRVISTNKAGWNAILDEHFKSAILSAFLTPIVNFASNTANTVYHYGVWRAIDTALGIFSKHHTQLGEWRYILGGVFPGIWEGLVNGFTSYITEMPTFEDKIGKVGESDIKNVLPANKGIILGRWHRWGIRANRAGDEFAKTLIAKMEVGSQAYRLAKQKKNPLTGKALQTYIRKQIANTNSRAWNNAFEHSLWLTHQQEGGKYTQAIKKGTIALKRKVPPLEALFPFVKTPVNIIENGVKASPFGIVSLIADIIDLVKAKEQKDKRKYRTLVARGVTNQIIAWSAMAVLSSIIGDDDEENPWITGTYLSKGERKQGERTKVAPMSFRLPGIEGRFSYAKIEPFATTIAMMVDALRKYKVAGKEGRDEIQKISMAFSAGVGSLLGQLEEKSMLQGVSEMVTVVENVLTAEDKTKAGFDSLASWASRFSAALVPYSGMVRGIGRSTQEEMPERGVWGKDQDYYDRLIRRGKQAIEIGQYFDIVKDEPKYDILGRKIKRDGAPLPVSDFLWRLLSPVKAFETRIHPLDRTLTLWNTRTSDPSERVFPEEPNRYYIRNGETTYMTDQQFREFSRLSGKVTSYLTRGITTDNPDKYDMKAIGKLISEARSESLKYLLQKQKWGQSMSEPMSQEDIKGVASFAAGKILNRDIQDIRAGEDFEQGKSRQEVSRRMKSIIRESGRLGHLELED